MAGMQFYTIDDFRNYIKRQLGSPVINVEIADEQIDDIIFDCVQHIRKMDMEDANYDSYLVLTLVPGVSAYSLSGSDVEAVYDFTLSTGTGGINTLFSPQNMILGSDFSVMGGTQAGQGMSLANYQISMTWLKELNAMFSTRYRVNYMPASQQMFLTPTPQVSGIGLLAVYRNESALALYSNPNVKKLAIAKTKKLWGLHLKKYQIALPGTGAINGQAIYDEGRDEEREALEDIRLESPGPDFFIA
jgi:hypothetical protein